MSRWAWILTLSLGLTAFVGCGESAPDAAGNAADNKAAAPAKPEAAKAEPLDVSQVTLTDEEIAEIKSLPDDQAALALKQKVCPISGAHLGGMGTPIKVSADGKTAFLCCEGCQGEFEENPKAALAKLDLEK